MTRNPFDEMERAFERMGKQLEGLGPEVVSETIRVDVVDDGDAYVVTADLPGFDRADIEVTLANRRLELLAERETESEEEGPDYVRRERRRGSLRRTVPLPGRVDADGTEATYENGVLTVTLPKHEADAGTDIPVN
jgi:HSP20 family protein